MRRSYIPAARRQKVMQEAHHRCGYCLAPQDLSHIVLEIEHIIPPGAGGTDTEDNLWAACSACNAYKGDRTHARDPQRGRIVQVFNPRQQKWARHFRWDATGTRMIGLTACGRATVEALRLNNEFAVRARERWVQGGWFPPQA
jgi:hypothetical protein